MSLRWKGPNFVFWSQPFVIVAVMFHVTYFWDLYVQRTFLRMWKTVAHEHTLARKLGMNLCSWSKLQRSPLKYTWAGLPCGGLAGGAW